MLVHQDYFRDGRVRRYAESLADGGIKVDILCVKSDYQPGGHLHKNIRVFVVPMTRGYKKSPISYMVEYFLIMICFFLWLLYLHFKYHYHIIHVHNMPDFLVFTTIIPKWLGSKIVLDIHDPTPEFFMSKFTGDRNSQAVKILQFLERKSIDFSDAVITANENFKKNLILRGIPAEKITVVVNVPDIKLFDRKRYKDLAASKSDRFILVYPGTIAPRYGLDTAIKAIPGISVHIPNVLLRIVGQHTEYADELGVLISNLSVEPFVEIIPAVPIENVAHVMAQSDVGIYPALPDAHMDIATPSKVLEFAYMGIPIIASRLTVLLDYFSEEGIYFFEPGSSDEFTGCVLDLYKNPQKRTQLVEASDRNFVERYSWDNEKRKYFILLNNLTDKDL